MLAILNLLLRKLEKLNYNYTASELADKLIKLNIYFDTSEINKLHEEYKNLILDLRII